MVKMMDTLSSVKMTALAATQYASSVNENTTAQLQRHAEVLLALLKTNEVNTILKQSDASKECINSLVDVLAHCNQNKEAMNIIFKLLIALHDLPYSYKLFFEQIDINYLLMKYVVEYSEFEPLNSMEDCLQLLEKTTINCKICHMSCHMDKFLQCLLDETLKNNSCLATICLGILSNLVSNNIAFQAQLKGMLSSTNMKQLMNYLQTDSILNKINFLSIITFICWDDELGKKFFSIKNVRQTLKVVFSQLVAGGDFFTQHRAGKICIELLKHEEIVQQISIYDSEHNIVYRLLASLQKDVLPVSSAKLLEVMLALCQIKAIRSQLCKKILESNNLWQLLLKISSNPLHQSDHESSLAALKLVGELCEEMSDLNVEINNYSWFDDLLSVLIIQISPLSSDDSSTLSMLLLNAELAKKIKALQILNSLCSEDKLVSSLAKKIDCDLLNDMLKHQLCQNVFEVTKPLHKENCCFSVNIVLLSLALAHKLKTFNSNFEKLLYKYLEDSKLIPFLAKAITSCDRKQMQIALHLHQESLPFINFPSIQLAETICFLNEKACNKSIVPIKAFNQNQFVPYESVVLQEAKPNCRDNLKAENKNLSFSKTVNNDENDKENIENLIASMQAANNGDKNDQLNSDSKTSQIVSLYENKLASLATEKNNLQDLLEAKTLALSQADRIISQQRVQISKNDDDARKMAEILCVSESCSERLTETVKTLECDRSTMERDLKTVVEENRNLHKVADQYDKMQVAFQDNLHKMEVMERNLKTLHQEYDTLKELHDMVQRHSEKLKQQHSQMTLRLEEVEEERMRLLKRVSELENSVSDLTQLVEEQDRNAQILIKEKNDRIASIKAAKAQIAKLDEVTKDLKTKESQLSRSLSEKDVEIANLKQNLEKQSKTLSMITELANAKHNPR